MFESDELQELDTGIEVLTISHPLNMHEKEQIVYQILSTLNLKQVYFTDNVDLSTVELVKCLIEFSSNIDDKCVEKIILINDESTIRNISFLNYKYPDTWYLSFKNNPYSNELVSIPRYRNMNNYFESIALELNSSKYSVYEKIIKIYDIVKVFKHDQSITNNFYLPDMIESHSANSYGFNILFSILLSNINVESYVGYFKVDGVKKSITLVNVVDDNYHLDGIYLFDPTEDNSSDSFSTASYYNYFGLNIFEVNSLRKRIDLAGILGILSIPNYSISSDKMTSFLNGTSGKKDNALVQAFKCDYKKIHQRFHSTAAMDLNTIFSAVKNIYSDMDNNYINGLESKYLERRNQLFNDMTIFIDETGN